jgi:hypothetical protein
MARREEIKKLVISHQRHLQKLQEQAAILGINTPPGVLIQIEDLEAKIAELRTELDNLDAANDEATWESLPTDADPNRMSKASDSHGLSNRRGIQADEVRIAGCMVRNLSITLTLLLVSGMTWALVNTFGLGGQDAGQATETPEATETVTSTAEPTATVMPSIAETARAATVIILASTETAQTATAESEQVAATRDARATAQTATAEASAQTATSEALGSITPVSRPTGTPVPVVSTTPPTPTAPIHTPTSPPTPTPTFPPPTPTVPPD